MSARGDHASVAGSNVLVRVSAGLPPDATMRPSSSVVTPAQNMSWKVLSTVRNVSAVGSKTAEYVYSRSAGNESVCVDAQVSTRPSGSDAAEMATCGHAITGPHEPSIAASGGPPSWPSIGIARFPPPGGG